MEERFLEAVKTYLDIVEKASISLIESINNAEHANILNKYGLYEYVNKNHKFEFVLGERKYHFHGAGCTVLSKDVPLIEWDFGYRSWWCGIEPFKMARTLKHFMADNREYFDGVYVKKQCEQYLSEGLLIYYNGQYYVDLLKVGAKKIYFPADYDKLVIQYKGITKSYPKSKLIDKFMRKSTSVYEAISELENNYTLIFYNKENEVARTLYNDIAYPDAAVKIMNEQIVKPHQVEQWKL